MNEQELFDLTANKTREEIVGFYNNEYSKAETIMREMCRKYISRRLMDTNEDNKLACEIHIEPAGAFGMSSLEMPCIVAMWQEPSDGTIWFDEEYNAVRDFDDYPTDELIQIVKEMPAEE